MDAKASQFRKRLVQMLKSKDLETFDFAEFARQEDIPPELAREIAESLFLRLCTQATADGVVTISERARVNRAARILQIETERAETILFQSNFGGSEILGGSHIDLPPEVIEEDQESVEQIQISLGISTDNSRMMHRDSSSRDRANVSSDSVPFSQDKERFKKSLLYTNTASIPRVQSDLNFVRHFDRESEKGRRLGGRISGYGFGIGVVGVICIMMEFTIPGVSLLVVGMAGFATGLIMERWKSRFDLENRRYELVSELLKLLSKDMAPDEDVTIHLNFQPHNQKSNLIRTGKVGYWNAKFYVNKWLELRGRFLDGTKFSITLVEKQQDRHRKKRSASGKTKHKYKSKNASEAIVSLKIKQKRYPQSADLKQKIRKSVQLPGWTNLKSIDAEGDSVTIRSATKLPWDASGPNEKPEENDGVNWLALMFLSLYSSLNLSK